MNLNNYFLPYQLAWINDDAPMKFYPKSRRIGITYGTSYRSHSKCMKRKGFTQWVTSRDEFTAKEFITDYVALWARASNAVAKGLAGDNAQVVDVDRDIRAFVVGGETICAIYRLGRPAGSGLRSARGRFTEYAFLPDDGRY